MHSTLFVLDEAEADPEEKRKAALEVAQELVTSAHRGSGS